MNRFTWEDPVVTSVNLENCSSPCVQCNQQTNHKQLVSAKFSRTYHADDKYGNEITYINYIIIMQCQGCMSFSVKNESMNSEDIDYSDEMDPFIEIEYYPSRTEVKNFEDDYFLPQAISNLYSETVTAINNNCYTIAGIGIRAIIETICNEHKIAGRTLERKIDNLYIAGKISNDSKSILNSLRKVYNKSAHESFKPNKEQLLLSLEIVKLLLRQLYVHSGMAKKHFTEN